MLLQMPLSLPVRFFYLHAPNHRCANRRQKRPFADLGRLVNFQVSEPVLTPSEQADREGCVYTLTLMEHVFANSYDVPFVGKQPSSPLQ